MTLRQRVCAAAMIAATIVCAPIARARDQRAKDEHPGIARDPDRPSELRGRIDRDEYIRRRNEMINLLRGSPDASSSNARLKTLREMEPARIQRRLRGVSSTGSPTSWTSIGPAPIPNGQTAEVVMPVSGLVSAIAVHPSNPDIAYAGTPNGGLYRTLDGGNTWKALLDDAMSLSVGAIVIDPSNPGTIYVGTGEENSSCIDGVGVYRITDAETVASLEGPLGSDVFAGRGITKIVLAQEADAMFVATTPLNGPCVPETLPPQPGRGYGIYRSLNLRAVAPAFAKVQVLPLSSPLDMAMGAARDVVLDPLNHNNLFCAIHGGSEVGGVYVTRDALAPSPTFIRTLGFSSNFYFSELDSAKLAITHSGSSTFVYAATSELGGCDYDGGRLHISFDGGTSWSLRPEADGFCGGQCNFDLAIAVSPMNPGVIYLGGSVSAGSCSHTLIRALNLTDFAPAETGLHCDVHAIAIAPSNPNIVYFGSDGGIWRSVTAGSTWTSLNNRGFNATMFESLATHPLDGQFVIGGTQDNGTLLRRADGTWFRADWGDAGAALVDQNATDTTAVRMYHTFFDLPGYFTLATVDNVGQATEGNWTVFGCDWWQIPNGLDCSEDVLFYPPMTLGPGNPNTVYFGAERLYRSENGARTMMPVSQPSAPAHAPISAIGVSPQNDNVRIIGTTAGQLLATSDGSLTLTDVTPPLMRRVFVSRAVIDPDDSNIAYVTLSAYFAGPHIWKTTNLSGGATTWVPLNGFRFNIPVAAFAIDPADSNNLFAGYDGGVWRSQDGGVTWSDFNEGLPKVPVFDIALQPKSRALRIATYGRGMWQRTVCQSIALGPDTLAHGVYQQMYSQNLSATGALGPVRFSSSGNVPPGLVVSADGQVSGTPASGGTFQWTAIATDQNGCTGSRSFTIVVHRAMSATAVSASPSTYGSTASFVASVTSGATGSVTFADGAVPIGTSSLDNAARTTLTTSSLAAGVHAITATYSGDTNFERSFATVEQVVGRGSQTVSWAAAAPIVYGSPLTDRELNAAVSVAGSSPAGAITYDPPSGTILEAGDWTVIASAAATMNYNAAASSTTRTVLKATPLFDNLTVATIAKGSETATVAGHISYGPLTPPAGETVSIALNGTTQAATIGDGGSFSAVFTTASLPVAVTPYAIRYMYSGDRNFNAAVGSGSITVAYVGNLNTTVSGPGFDDGNGHRHFDVSFSGPVSGQLPGTFTAFLELAPPLPGRNVRSVVTGGRWLMVATDPHGAMTGRVVSGVIQWNADATKATIDLQFTIDGGKFGKDGNGRLSDGVWDAATITGALQLSF
jgi:hypothetical protein